MSDTVEFEGGCLCGALRYRAISSPIRGVICHCSMCRKHSGAPILAFVHFRIEDFTWVRGEPTRYRSSAFAERGFCSTCGSTISMHETVLADRVQIAVGTLDEPQRVHVDDHVWTQHQLPWFQVDDQLPRFPASSTAVATMASGGESETGLAAGGSMRKSTTKTTHTALLSGGNPQVAKADGDAPVQTYIAAMPGWKRDVGRRLDALIATNAPGVRKAVKWNSPFYGMKGQGWFVAFHVFTNYVKVTFFKGTSLQPVPPGGTGKEARWIDIHENDLDEGQLAKWIQQAAAIPGWGKS